MSAWSAHRTAHPTAATTALALVLALTGAGLGACGPKEATPEGGMDPSVSPVLPAPSSAAWALGERVPRDPLVAAVVGDSLSWVEALSGAATGLVLDGPPPYDLDAAAWAAVRAGYPHRVRTLLTGDVPAGTLPEELPQALRDQLRPGDHLGLVRARVDDRDRWLALVGSPGEAPTPTLPKELAEGARLDLAGLGPWRIVSPSGVVREGSAAAGPVMEESGEWWLELLVQGSARASLAVPVFVGMPTPEEPLLDLPGEPAADAEEAEELALALLDEVRAAFELPALRLDPTLDTLARHPLEGLRAGSWSAEEGEQRLRAAGFVTGAGQVACSARSVARCLQGVLGHGPSRGRLLEPDLVLVGLAAEASDEGVQLVVNLGAE